MLFWTGMLGNNFNINESINIVRDKFWPTAIANWKFWIGALFVIYAFIPYFYRGVADVAVGTVWAGIYTYVFNV